MLKREPGRAPLVLEHVPPGTLQPAGYNPRTMSPGARQRLKNGIEAFGLVDPLVVRRADRLILGGHQRHAVAMELGLATVPVVYVDVDDTQAKALNVLLNNPHAQGQWDADRLADLLRELENSELDATLTGFDEDQIAAWLEGSATDETGAGDDEPPGMTISYTLVFDSQEQQDRWFVFLRRLAERYPETRTIGERLQIFVDAGGGNAK